MSVVRGFCPSMSNLLFSFLHDMLDGTKRASERTNEIGTPRGRHRRLRLSKPKPPAKREVVWFAFHRLRVHEFTVRYTFRSSAGLGFGLRLRVSVRVSILVRVISSLTRPFLKKAHVTLVLRPENATLRSYRSKKLF